MEHGNEQYAVLKRIASRFDRSKFRALHETMTFAEYIDRVYANPRLIRTSFQRIYDMIMSFGYYEFEKDRKILTHYNFFDDEDIPIYGLEETLDSLVKFIRGAAGGYGTEKRVLLLHGPVGSAKSTIARRLKKGLEKYSRTEVGSLYTFKWINLPTGEDGIYSQKEDQCPMHEDPIKLIAFEDRQKVIAEINEIFRDSAPEGDKNSLYQLRSDAELCPRCKKFMEELLAKYDGDWEKVVANHIEVVRMVISEADRVGIGTFQPKDEKNQDSTELTGDINFGKLPQYGSDSDSRAFNFDGEFCFPAGTPVRMADGTEKNIEDVFVGDKVVTHLGNIRSVLNTMTRKYTGTMVSVNILHFPFQLTMTADHPVACIENRCNWRWQPGRLIWKKAKDLSTDDRLLIGWRRDNIERTTLDISEILGQSISTIDDGIEKVRIVTGEKKNAVNRFVSVSPSLARLFGLYLAEGCCTSKKVVFNLSAKEESLATEIISLIKGIFGVKATTRLVNKNKTGRVVEVNNVNVVKVFKKIAPGLADSKRVPALFMISDEQVKMGLVSGWLDGDGHKKIISVAGKPAVHISGVTISHDLARDMMVLCLSSGMASAGHMRPAYQNHKLAYTVGVSGKQALKVFPELKCQAVNKGINLYNTDINRTDFGYARRIKSIDVNEVVDLPVYDFEVEEDHSFLAKDIAVHNCVANRGMCEFIEMLKLAQEFLYDLLGASQEKQIKPKKFPQTSVDEFLMGHTNGPEFDKLKSNQYMEALKDRTNKIDVPYLIKWADEIKVLDHDYNNKTCRQHIAPHTKEIAALWSVLTRLIDDKESKLDLVKKAKLYNGEALPGYTEDSIKELHDKHPNEGMFGISIRYVQDKFSNCLSEHHDYINPFMVMNEIREGLDNHSLITKKDDLARYHACVDMAIKELDEILKDEVRKALTGDEKAIERLCANYIDNVMAYIKKAKVRNQFTLRDEPPNERLMRSIEEKIDVPDTGVDNFRRMIAAFIGDLANSGKKFRWDSNPELKKALEAKLFEDVKDHIKLSALNISAASTVSPDLQEKIDAIKKRLIDQYGYNEKSATDVLDYVGSIFARGESSKED